MVRYRNRKNNIKRNNPEEKTSSLLNIIGEQSKENLFTALAAYQKKEKSKLDTIRRISVSYTHLGVYKRQLPASLPT